MKKSALSVQVDRFESDISTGPNAPAGTVTLYGQLIRETIFIKKEDEKFQFALRQYRQVFDGGSIAFMFRAVWLEPYEIDIYIRLRHTIEAPTSMKLKEVSIQAKNVYGCLLNSVLENTKKLNEFNPHGDRIVARHLLGQVLPPNLVQAVE